MSDAGGRPRREDLPYGLTTEQLLAITDVRQKLRDGAEAMKHTVAEETANEMLHSAEVLDFYFPEIVNYWERLVATQRRTRPC